MSAARKVSLDEPLRSLWPEHMEPAQARAYRALSRHGITTIGELTEHDQGSLLRDVPGFGLTCLLEVNRALFGRFLESVIGSHDGAITSEDT